MASSSTSASTCVYDIFINHRGPDCKKTLATYLYDRLSKHGLRVFLDQRELQEGDPFPSQIEGAIRTASVHIAIFSPRYAESIWCLKELVLMLESNKTIIPVFYGVQPSELRWTQRETGLYDTVLRMFPWVRCMLCSTRDENGVYARSLSNLQEKKTIDPQTGQKKPRHDSNIIAKWRETLSHVANISGFDMETCNGDEQQLLEKVVEGVLKRFPRKLHVSKYTIALDQKVQDFEREMYFQRQSEQTRVMGIVGLGGVGKTTLAKEIFNRQVSNYNRSCFLSDVRDKPLNSLQSMLLKDLAQLDRQINSSDEGIELLRKYLSSRKALIILDDVDQIQQLDALLLPVKDVLEPGSLILVTTRNKDVLKSAGIVESSIYKLTGLDRQQSKELFCSHAFQQSNPVVGFEEVVEKFLNACDGLPLSLTVLGAHLHGKKNDLKYWEAQLRKISKALPMDIQKSLKVSYDGLDDEEKQIFLDVACFFVREDKDTAIRIWDGSGWEGELGFLNLENKCLLAVDEQNRITMHDHLRDLGRDLAEKEPPHCPRRLWRPTDNLLNLSDQSHVRGINMVPQWPPRLLEKIAGQMSSVQLVMAEGDSVQSIFSAAQTPQLIWLRWVKFPYPSLPSWIPLENLRVLQIEGKKFEMIWTHESQVPVQIRELHIHSVVPNITKSIRMLKHLEKLVLANEKKDFGLRTLPEEFGDLESLKYLELSGYFQIKGLPESFGKLTNLQTIHLSSCSSLQMLPQSFGNLVNLQTIRLPRCFLLHMLPDSFGNLVNLQTIELSYCWDLQMLPDSFGNLVNLQTIDLSHCYLLQMLPNSFGNLVNLQAIDLSHCQGLQMLPDSFGNLVNLQAIDLSNCSSLQMLPDSFGNLVNLQTIDLSRCYCLQMLPDSFGNLANLTTIDLFGCSHLQRLPDSFGNLAKLQTIDLSGCSHLQMLPVSFSNLLPNLRSMKLLDTGLKELPSALEYFGNLKILHLGSKSLEILSFSFPRSLEELFLHFCHGFKCLPDSIRRLTRLRKLTIEEMNTLEVFKIEDCQPSDPPFIKDGAEIEAFSNSRVASEVSYSEDVFPNLQHVRIVDCNSLVEVGALPSTLLHLSLINCGALRKVGGLCSLSKLQTLTITRCMELEELPSTETDCNALVEVGAMPPTLKLLALRYCGALRKIGELCGLSKLEWLDISGCMELEELPSIETLVSLKDLTANGCVKLKRIRGLLQCTRLRLLRVRGCSGLEEVEGLEHCTWLRHIDASGCDKFRCH